jgi:hypothetical protein
LKARGLANAAAIGRGTAARPFGPPVSDSQLSATSWIVVAIPNVAIAR